MKKVADLRDLVRRKIFLTSICSPILRKYSETSKLIVASDEHFDDAMLHASETVARFQKATRYFHYRHRCTSKFQSVFQVTFNCFIVA